MTKPVRVQRRRTKGWMMPPNTVNCTRPGPLGNPFTAKAALDAGYQNGQEMSVWAFRQWLRGAGKRGEFASYERERRQKIEALIPELRGKNLMCFCDLCPAHKDGKPFDVTCADCEPCHVDVIGPLANAASGTQSGGEK